MGFRTRFTGRTAKGILVAVLVSGLSAQISETRPQVGVPEDWTHHRIRFSSSKLRQHPEIAAGEPRAAVQLYREAFRQARAAMGSATAAVLSDATSIAPHRDWSVALGGRLQPGVYPAKWQADPTAPPSCTGDFVIYALNVAGTTGGQPSIVGLNRLYSDGANPLCPGFAQPNFLFSYNTTTLNNGRILTSPVLSLDGKKVAFIETNLGAARSSVLHVLKIPTTGTQATATPSVAPPAGADVRLTIANTSNTRSSPWIDYKNDVIYVGLDNGRLYKITGVFNGTPAVAGAPWPILIVNGNVLSSPVLDFKTGKLFIGVNNGRVYALNVNSPGTPPTAIQVGRTGSPNPTIYDSPMFDATGNTIFAITSNDSVLTGASVVQIDTTTLNVVTRVLIGQGSTGGTNVNLYDGDFEDAYFNNPATGHLLVCGTGAADSTPYRYLLGFNGSGVLQPGSSVQLSTDTGARCSPITEFFNSNISGGTDFFFWGVSRSCPGFGVTGCVMALANGTTLSSTRVAGGTSGIVIDNNYVTLDGGSSIYFTAGAANTAYKMTQQGLQ